MASPVVHITNKADYDKRIAEAKGLVVVDFTAKWCGPCRRIAPTFEALANENSDVVFLKVDVDECEDVAAAEKISAMPTFYFYKGGKKVADFSGASEAKLKELVNTHK